MLQVVISLGFSFLAFWVWVLVCGYLNIYIPLKIQSQNLWLGFWELIFIRLEFYSTK